MLQEHTPGVVHDQHVTCSVVLIDASWRVLHIRHNALGAWLRPGGHLEPEDTTLCDAALRELSEETGIAADLVSPLDDDVPIDIDVHAIPANPHKPEPQHLHFDLRHAFRLREPTTGPLSLQAAEVSGYRWLPSEHITPESLRGRLAHLRG